MFRIKSLAFGFPIFFIFFTLLVHINAHAAIVEYELAIARQEVNITGKSALAMTINGGIPGPTLYFKEGDFARIHVHNKMSVETSMHWHGVLLPPDMDGVPFISFPPIKPGTTFTYEFPIEFDAKEPGDWFFHCHLLYHMESGMAQVVHYKDFTLNPQLAAIRPNLYKDSWYFWGEIDAISNMTQGFLTFSSTRNILTAEWEAGWQKVEKTEWEGIFTWDRYINRFFTFFAGADLLGESNNLEDARAVVGIRYLLPFNLESRTWIDSEKLEYVRV